MVVVQQTPSFPRTLYPIGSDELSSLLNNSLIQNSEVPAGYPSALARPALGMHPVGNTHMLGTMNRLGTVHVTQSEKRRPAILSEPFLGSGSTVTQRVKVSEK